MLERKMPPCTDTFGDSWAGEIGMQDGLLRISEAMEERGILCPPCHYVSLPLFYIVSKETDTPNRQKGGLMDVHATPGFGCWVITCRDSSPKGDEQFFTSYAECENHGHPIIFTLDLPASKPLTRLPLSHVNRHHFGSLCVFKTYNRYP